MSEDIFTVDSDTFRARIDSMDGVDGIGATGKVTDKDTWEKITCGELAGFSITNDSLTEQAAELARQEAAKIELEVENAILDDYDGIDIHRPLFGVGGVKPQSAFEIEVEPWNYPAPDADNGMRTERYTWDWFDTEELKEHIRNGTTDELLKKLDGGQSDNA